MAVSFSVMGIVLLHFASMKVIWTVFSFINGWCSAYITSSLLSKSKEKRGRFSFQCSSGAEKNTSREEKKVPGGKCQLSGRARKYQRGAPWQFASHRPKTWKKKMRENPKTWKLPKVEISCSEWCYVRNATCMSCHHGHSGSFCQI